VTAVVLFITLLNIDYISPCIAASEGGSAKSVLHLKAWRIPHLYYSTRTLSAETHTTSLLNCQGRVRSRLHALLQLISR